MADSRALDIDAEIDRALERLLTLREIKVKELPEEIRISQVRKALAQQLLNAELQRLL
jgi:hypothetical protein